MADTKISALTENTASLGTDILAIVDDPGGTPLTQKTTIANLLADKTFDTPTMTGETLLGVGSATEAPLKFQSGTNLTTAEAGAFEYDGKVLYSTPDNSSRGVNESIQFITLTSAYTIPTEGGGLRAMFNSPSNGAVTLKGNTTYMFQCFGSVSSLSATSGTFSLGFLGTASTTEIRYVGGAGKTATTAATLQVHNVTSTTSTAVTSASTTSTAQWFYQGKVVVDTGGTFIPAIGHSVVANPIVGDNTTFRIWPVGNNTVQSVGNWS